jgi:molecular chaperone DnaK (HSP70)
LPEDDLFSHDFDLDNIAIDEQVATSLSKVKTTNVTAHSLGVVTTLHTGDKRVNVLIPRNSRLPSEITKHYGLTRDGQTRVEIHIVEGESEFVGDCIRIGHCQIDQLPPGLKERSPVAITFSYDTSNCLHVRAVEVTSGKSATTSVRRKSGMDRASVAKAREEVSGIRVI